MERTTTALLADLNDPGNDAAWAGFDERFRPVLVSLARRLGLGEEDAADAAQETLLRFVREYRAGAYSREKGRLHAWLLGIARNCIQDQRRRRAVRHEDRGQSAIDQVADETEVSRVWDEEYRQSLLRRGLEALHRSARLDPRTLRAFEMLTLEGGAPDRVAGALGMSLNDVYLAKHRCLKRLRALVDRLDARLRLE